MFQMNDNQQKEKDFRVSDARYWKRFLVNVSDLYKHPVMIIYIA